MYFDNIAQLLAAYPNYASVPTNTEFHIGGRWQTGDGGGGTFVWVPASQYISTPPLNGDGGIDFRCANDLSASFGYFKRVFSGPINVRWFGAILGAKVAGVPITDVTQYVHAARDSNAFTHNGTLYFPQGIYPGAFEFEFISIDGRNEFNIIGDGHGTVLKSNGTFYPLSWWRQ